VAQELERHAAEAGRRVRCLVQVNVGGEDQKNGASEDRSAFSRQPAAYPHPGRRFDGHPAVSVDPESGPTVLSSPPGAPGHAGREGVPPSPTSPWG